ncbi:MAG: decaprenylphospho-beta-D-ribofuranose 2-oxidase [Ilumatobacteraceae bacterium]
MPNPSRARLWGWGQTNPTVADELRIDAAGAVAAMKEGGDRGVLARGLGRSYGDAAQNGGGLVLRLTSKAADIVLDPAKGLATVGAGVSIDELLRVIVPRGFFVPVTPGTRFVTIGGAIASDIHGKNHHVDGSIGRHIESITMVLADGSTAVIGPRHQPALFWATVGGMGLTGLMLEATIRLIPIETSRMRVDTSRIADLDELLATMSQGDDDFRYSVAWIDLVAKGRHLGRSVLSRGDHAETAHLDAKDAVAPFAYGPHQLVSVPPLVPPMGVLNHATVAAFNEFWFRKAPKRRTGEIQGIGAFFHPLDLVGSWNRLYGSRGMVQYQFVVPFGAEDTLRRIVERLSGSGVASFLAVLKRFGPADPGLLSFPQPGWTLALDIPAGVPGLAALLGELDVAVADAGGRVYLAKDAVLSRELLPKMYPRLAEWQAVRARVDPDATMCSDLSRRLGL